jgi:hypothetical protein
MEALKFILTGAFAIMVAITIIYVFGWLTDRLFLLNSRDKFSLGFWSLVLLIVICAIAFSIGVALEIQFSFLNRF